MAKEQSQEELIVENIELVTNGIIKDLKVNNAYASWKNTAKGLNFIKENKKEFYLGVNLWLKLTEQSFIGTDDNDINNEIIESTKHIYPWLTNFLNIKKLVDNKK